MTKKFNKKLSLSILSADLSNLEKLITQVVQAGVTRVHLDIMDGNFVPNITIGPDFCRLIKKYKKQAELDVHLMVTNVAQAISWFKDIADIITFHVEVGGHIDRLLQTIRGHGIKAGLAINPATPLTTVEYVLEYLDIITVMTVNPGFGGQKFIDRQINKIIQLRAMIDQRGLQQQLEIQVDGGINTSSILALTMVDSYVVGSAIFKQVDYVAEIKKLNDIINNMMI